MNRRSLLTAASAGLIVPSLLVGSSFAAEGSMTHADADYAKKTMHIGAFSKAISEMAEQKAHRKSVKDFAKYETAEQTAIAEVLTDERDPKPPAFSDEQQAMLKKLGNETGESFDKAYIAAEIEGHEKLRKIQEAFLAAHGMKSDDGHVALLAKTVIDMHLDMLDTLRKEVG